MARKSVAPTGDDHEVATVIGLYALGELTLGEAADRLDVSRTRMRDLLREAGVELRIGPRSTDEAMDELNAK